MTKLGRIELPKTHPLCLTNSRFKITAKLQEELCLLGQIGVYREASELAEKLLDLEISDKQIRRICIHYGSLLDKAIEANIETMIPRLETTNSDAPTYI